MIKVRGASPRKDIEAIIRAVEREADGIRLVTFNTVKGQLARRIFNEGLATNGSRIGNYAPSTKKTRNDAGRRIDTVDLEMTGTLRNAIATGTADGRIVLGLADQQEPEISVENGRIKITGTSTFGTVDNAIKQEAGFNKEIFAPSNEETDRGEKTILKELNRVAINALKSS